MYYPYSENKGGYREADLRLCFRICKSPVGGGGGGGGGGGRSG